MTVLNKLGQHVDVQIDVHHAGLLKKHRRIREVKFRLITRRCHILGVMEERRARSCNRRRAALELARLMVVHEIGVRTRIRYAVNWIDEEYFDGEDL